MKYFFLLLLVSLTACQPKNVHQETPVDWYADRTFDPELAKEVQADNYGMSRYVMAYLKKGPNRDRSKEEAAELQRLHMQNIVRLAEEGKLVLAGPFLDDGEVRGIYVFDVETIAEAEALTKTDPAIQAGSLVMELHPWYGSAALKLLNGLHYKVAQDPI